MNNTVACSIRWLCIVKNDHFHEGGKVARSCAIPIKPFSVVFYDLKITSFKFGNNNFINFKMLGSSHNKPVGKINISSLFSPILEPSIPECRSDSNGIKYILNK